jgi:hypothetical protein
VALAMLALGLTPAALVASIGKQGAAALAKRAASARVEALRDQLSAERVEGGM